MSANNKQVGGDHYRRLEYQHWDFITDLRLPYLIGCATKYPTRWRGKNGLEDLRKAVHYVDKAEERGIVGIELTDETSTLLSRFVGQLPPMEASVVHDIVVGKYQAARNGLYVLIASNNDAELS